MAFLLVMKKLFFALTALAVIASCAKEQEVENPETAGNGEVGTVILSANLPETKTALGEKSGDVWPNYWSAGDKISVNGVSSEALDDSFAGKASATFTVDGIAAPFYAAYPASALSEYNAGSATITIPSEQVYVAGSYDPAAYVMLATGSETQLSFTSKVAIYKLTPTGEKSISKVSLISLGDDKIAGEFTTNFVTLTPSDEAVTSVSVSSSTPVAPGTPWFIVVPAVDYTANGLEVKIFDSEGGCMTRHTKPDKAWEAGKMYASSIPYTPDPLNISAEGITSSTAIICWNASYKDAFTIGVYSDETCNSIIDSYSVPADASCWGGNTPRFCVSGLTSGSTYYVRVTDVTTGTVSNVLTVIPAAFENVPVSSTPAAVGDVILAEDFGELRWDSDIIGRGVGYFPTWDPLPTSFASMDISSFRQIKTSSEKVLTEPATALASSRLEHWAQGANNNLYIHPGYIKLVGNKKVTHLVTPALDNIPDGMLATLEVEVTASAYYSESDGKFTTTSAIVAVQPAGDFNELVDDAKTNNLDLTTNIAPITLDEASAWKKYTVTLSGVAKGDRLAFGAASDVTQNDARMNLSDMKVTIKALEEPALVASCKAVSSSTLVFTWTHQTYSAAEDIAKPYTFALYRDSACTDLVVSFESTENADRWDNKTPCFVFGGLNPSTEYWFVATDTDSGISSDPVSATTAAFTVVEPADVTNPQAGDILLAEDFSEISHGPDELAVAAGFVTSTYNLLTVPSGVNPDGTYCNYSNTGNRVFGSGWDISGSRMDGWGFFGNSSCYSRNGYLRVGATGGRTHIVTPALSCIPAGKLATIDVTVTATKYDSPIQIAVFAEKGLTMNTQTDPSKSDFRKYTGASLSDGKAFDISTVKNWDTKTVTISNVDADCQLLIGSLENYTDPSDSKQKNRFYFNDIVVKLVSIDEIPVQEISDDATFLEFVNAVASGNKDLEAVVSQDIALSSATVDAFESIEGYEGSLDGGNHTISGLTKPLFATLEGTVQNLTLNSTISSSDADDPIWGILAKQLSAGSVSGCTAQGSITYSATSPSAQAYIGGLVGKYSGGTISGCYNAASITYTATGSNKIYIGGVVSNNEKSTLSDCHSTGGTISFTGSSTAGPIYVGGVVGYDTKTIDSCTNAMTVDLGGTFSATSNNYFCPGGIAGKVTGGSITNCLNTGDVIYSQKNGGSAGYTFVGGLVGQIKGTISNSSNGGTVSFTGKVDSQNPYIGGIVGSTDSSEGSITGKYSSASATNYGEVVVNTSTQSKKYVYVGGIAGRLHTSNTITATNNGPVTITKLTCTQAFVGGLVGYSSGSTCVVNSGSANMAGGVITINALTGKGTSSYSCYIGGVVGRALGSVTADNAGKLVFNGLSSTLNSSIGGIVGQNEVAVSGNNTGDIEITSGTTFKKSMFVGGIVGRGQAAISNSTNSGNISNAAPLSSGSDYLQLGGIVGYNNSSATITNCHNTGDVTNTANSAGYLYVGGITSESDALISGCTNTGDVSNSGDSGNGHPICVGGITGVASANVESSSNGTATKAGGIISNTGNSAEDICIGGVVGWNNNKTINSCFNKADVSNAGDAGNIAVGGVVGWSSASSTYEGSNTSEGDITNTGTASTAAYTGDVIGHQAE